MRTEFNANYAVHGDSPLRFIFYAPLPKAAMLSAAISGSVAVA